MATFGLILLNNSAFERERSKQQNILWQDSLFANVIF